MAREVYVTEGNLSYADGTRIAKLSDLLVAIGADPRVTALEAAVAAPALHRHVFSLQVLPTAGGLVVVDGAAYMRVPSILNGMKLVAVAAHVFTASSSGLPTIQVFNTTTGAQDMLSTPLTIDVSELDSSTAAVPAVIDPAKATVVTADILRIDVDVAGTGTLGLIVELQFEAT